MIQKKSRADTLLFREEPPHQLVMAAIAACAVLTETERVAVYNQAALALRALVADVCDEPALSPQVIAAENLRANDYNPNKVAAPELDLLEQSIRCDGVTMAVVTWYDRARNCWEVVDGFHRRTVVVDRLGRRYVPCTEIDRTRGDRMASTIRHNRARGKHQIDLMATIVRNLMEIGWDDARIAAHIGMSEEELLRIKQAAGVARLMASSEYHRSWGTVEETQPETEGDDDDPVV